MPSPLAHVGVTLALRTAGSREGERPWDRIGLFAAAASVAPDADILAAALLPGGIAWHRGPTHSLLGAALLGLAIAAFGAWTARRSGARWPALAWLLVVVSAILHVPLDWSTGQPGSPEHFGVPWAWPFTARKWIDPNPWFGAYHIDKPGFLAHMFAREAIPVYGREALTVAIAMAVAIAIRSTASSRRTRSRAP